MAASASGPDDWRLLRLLAIYRLLLVGAMLIVHETGYTPQVFLSIKPDWYRYTGYGYAIAAMMLMLMLQLRRPRLAVQTHLQFLVDVCAIATLVYASGGVEKGLGALLLIPAVGCALVLTPRMAMLQAAIATLAMFGEEIARQLSGSADSSGYTATGVLGLIFFGTTLAASAVAQRARQSEALAEKVGSEFENLSRLNENIIETMQTGVVVLDSARRIRTLNAAACALLRTSVQAVGMPLERVARLLDTRVARWIDEAQIDEGPLLPSAGAPEVVVRYSRLGISAQAPVLLLIDDAVRLREQAQQIKLAALGRLSASIAHEIRNPLSAISHAGQLLAEVPELAEDGQSKRLLDMIRRHSERIDRIVKDVLALSRREAAAPSTIPLHAWLAHKIAVYRESESRQNRAVAIGDVPEALSIRFDTDHLQQVVFNLWDNAFAHAALPGREVAVSLKAGIDTDQRAWLDVRDNGPGVAATLLDRIFEPFFTTATSGNGLGLYLTRELCEYNQARIAYRSEPSGACFRISFAQAA